MSRPIRPRAITPFGAFINLVIAALVLAPVIFVSVVSPKIAAEAPATRPTLVDTATPRTSADASPAVDNELAENTLADTDSGQSSGSTAAPNGTTEELPRATSDSQLRADTTLVGAAERAQTMLRSQIEIYRQEHHGVYPLSSLVDLTQSTNARGIAGQGFPFGPYLTDIPENPFTHSAAVKPITSDPPTADDLTPGGGGWLYNAKTGSIWLDHPDFVAH